MKEMAARPEFAGLAANSSRHNRLFKLVSACGLLLVMLLCLFSATPVLAAPQVATVKGTATGDNYAAAVKDAHYKAVFKALTHLLKVKNANSEDVQLLLRDYDKYVLQCQTVQKSSTEKETFIIAKVTVDTDRLQADVEQLIASRHRTKIFQMPACFLIRVLQAENPEEADGIVLTTCSSHYQNLGFETETNYHYAASRRPGIALLAGESYAEFCNWAENKLLHEWLEYGFALLGEISLETSQQDIYGTTKTAHARIKAFDVYQKKYIGSFAGDYQYRASSAAEAERQVLNKAALDFAEVLGAQTLAYWAE